MFIWLLGVTFIISFSVCFLVSKLFSEPVLNILSKIVDSSIAYAWSRYINFSIYVVGISGGVRFYSLEEYLRERTEGYIPPVLTRDRWIMELYRTIIESLQSIAWMLLVFFCFSLIAYVIARSFELRRKGSNQKED